MCTIHDLERLAAEEAEYDQRWAQASQRVAGMVKGASGPSGPARPKRDLRPLKPWEVTPAEFEFLAEPSMVASPLSSTGFVLLGLSQEERRGGWVLVLRCDGGPAAGYRVLLPKSRAELFETPHRAFVEAALCSQRAVPDEVLADYPELAELAAGAEPGGEVPELDLPSGWDD